MSIVTKFEIKVFYLIWRKIIKTNIDITKNILNFWTNRSSENTIEPWTNNPFLNAMKLQFKKGLLKERAALGYLFVLSVYLLMVYYLGLL